MAKSQKIVHKKQKAGPVIYNTRQAKNPSVDLSVANSPVRAVNFVEVGEMTRPQIQLMLQQLNIAHSVAKGGIHYFLPVRDGRIGSDIVFEEEFLSVIDKICEVVDENGLNINAKIKLKNGAKKVIVVRQKI